MRRRASVIAAVCLIVAQTASASWLSDITGINIDIPAGKVELGAPNPAAIVPMLQNLPKDVAITLLGNVAGNALAFEIRRGEAFHKKNSHPIPPHIKQVLAPYYPAHILDGVSWVAFDPGVFTIGNQVIKQTLLQTGAVTMNRVIVFQRKKDGEESCSLWAHELTHVLQYDQMGIEAFAAIYATVLGAKQLEDAAYAQQDAVMKRIGFCPKLPTTPTPFVKPVKVYYAYAPHYVHGTKQLRYLRDFQPAVRKMYPAEGCARDFGSEADHTVTITNLCNTPIWVTRWHQGDVKHDVVVACSQCRIAANGSRTFKTPSKKPVTSIDYRY